MQIDDLCRFGDIYVLSPIFATMYAIICKLQAFSFIKDNRNTQHTNNDSEFFGSNTLKLSDRNNSIYKYVTPEIPETSTNLLLPGTSQMDLGFEKISNEGEDIITSQLQSMNTFGKLKF